MFDVIRRLPRKEKIAKIISYRTKLLTEDYRTQREEYANRRRYLLNTSRMEQSIAVRSRYRYGSYFLQQIWIDTGMTG